MPTLKVRITDAEALQTIRLSAIVDYLLERGWHSHKTIGKDKDNPQGRNTIYTRTTTAKTDVLTTPAHPGIKAYATTVGIMIHNLSRIEHRSQLEIFDDLRHLAPVPPGTYPQPWDGWVCFHCGLRFREYESALEHFGPTPEHNATACLR